MKKLILGIFVSIIFIYFSVRGVEIDKTLTAFKKSNYIFLVPTILIFLLVSLLRSLRWGVILSPIERISQRKLFPIVCVGQMCVTLIPMRIGEFVRPYLVNNETKIPLSTALATVLLERLFDVLTILGILFFVTFNSVLPDWLVKSGHVSIVPVVVLLVFALLLCFKPESTIKLFMPLLKIFPQKYQARFEGIIHNFAEGFKIISSPKRLVYILLLSLSVWGCFGLGIYALFSFSNLQLSPADALIVMVCTVIGVSLPAAPGMMGNFHYASIVALIFLGIQKSDALTFSMIFYFLAIGKNILLGLIFLPLVNLSFKDLKKRFNLGQVMDHN